MKTIYKYELELEDSQEIPVAGFLKALKVDEQNGKLFLWCLVDTDYNRGRGLNVAIVGTGNKMESYINNDAYFDTVIMSNGLVWHIFID